MRAMHMALHRAFAAEPHFLQAMVKAVYSVLYYLPPMRNVSW